MADDCSCGAYEELIEKSPGYKRALWNDYRFSRASPNTSSGGSS